MVLTPNYLFSWNNKYSKHTVILSHYIHQQWIHFSSSSYARQLTLCMLVFWSCEGVVILVHSSSSHLTMYHVFPLPLSGANWRSLFPLWGSGSPLPKMAPPSAGSAHTPLSGSETTTKIWKFWQFSLLFVACLSLSTNRQENRDFSFGSSAPILFFSRWFSVLHV